MAAELSPSGEAVRQGDPDRFLCALFAPAEARADLFALYAFNLEIAKVREVVSEPTLGEIRLQWWREALGEAAAGRPRRHPVAEALAGAIARRNLDPALFERMLEARSLDLADAPPADLKALERYADDTAGALATLAGQVLGVRGEAMASAGRHAGIAFALAGLLRAVPYHARHGRVYLPANVLAGEGLDPRDIAKGPSAALRRAVAVVAELGIAHVAAARRLRSPALRPALAALLPCRLAASDLERLARVDHDPHAAAAPWRPLARRIGLTACALAGRF